MRRCSTSNSARAACAGRRTSQAKRPSISGVGSPQSSRPGRPSSRRRPGLPVPNRPLARLYPQGRSRAMPHDGRGVVELLRIVVGRPGAAVSAVKAGERTSDPGEIVADVPEARRQRAKSVAAATQLSFGALAAKTAAGHTTGDSVRPGGLRHVARQTTHRQAASGHHTCPIQGRLLGRRFGQGRQGESGKSTED